MRISNSISVVIIFFISILLFHSCKKDKEKEKVPTLDTFTISLVTLNTAKSGGIIGSDGGASVTARGVCWSTSANPTIALTTKTSDGNGSGAFTSSLTGLTSNTTYYVRAYATNSAGTGYGNVYIFKTYTGILTDIDGNEYYTVTIRHQVWMAQNLNTTKYNDGTAIPNVTDNTAWASLTTGAYSDYNNTPAYSTTYGYGRLYNWFTVDNNAATNMASNGGKNVCPNGWHVPSNVEWSYLEYLSEGGKLKETGRTHWRTTNREATNESGFTAIPGGYRTQIGSYHDLGYYGYWWSSSFASGRAVGYPYVDVSQVNWNARCGFSLRCLQD
jgi:uncharacterized protein (TIGR02145 family)